MSSTDFFDGFTLEDAADHVERGDVRWWLCGWMDAKRPADRRQHTAYTEMHRDDLRAYQAGLVAGGRPDRWIMKIRVERKTPGDPCGLELEQDLQGPTATEALDKWIPTLRKVLGTLDSGEAAHSSQGHKGL